MRLEETPALVPMIQVVSDIVNSQYSLRSLLSQQIWFAWKWREVKLQDEPLLHWRHITFDRMENMELFGLKSNKRTPEAQGSFGKCTSRGLKFNT